jgi:hypothetical protein
MPPFTSPSMEWKNKIGLHVWWTYHGLLGLELGLVNIYIYYIKES